MEIAVITVISISNHLSAGSEFNQNVTYTGIIPVYIPHCARVNVLVDSTSHARALSCNYLAPFQSRPRPNAARLDGVSTSAHASRSHIVPVLPC